MLYCSDCDKDVEFKSLDVGGKLTHFCSDCGETNLFRSKENFVAGAEQQEVENRDTKKEITKKVPRKIENFSEIAKSCPELAKAINESRKCPHCQRWGLPRASQIGKKVKCNHCGLFFILEDLPEQKAEWQLEVERVQQEVENSGTKKEITEKFPREIEDLSEIAKSRPELAKLINESRKVNPNATIAERFQYIQQRYKGEKLIDAQTIRACLFGLACLSVGIYRQFGDTFIFNNRILDFIITFFLACIIFALIIVWGGEAIIKFFSMFSRKGLYSGGKGDSFENAIIINCNTTVEGIEAEYEWIESRYGKRDVDWKTVTRMHGITRGEGHPCYEEFKIELSSGIKRTIVFDVTSFYGKFP